MSPLKGWFLQFLKQFDLSVFLKVVEPHPRKEELPEHFFSITFLKHWVKPVTLGLLDPPGASRKTYAEHLLSLYREKDLNFFIEATSDTTMLLQTCSYLGLNVLLY